MSNFRSTKKATTSLTFGIAVAIALVLGYGDPVSAQAPDHGSMPGMKEQPPQAPAPAAEEPRAGMEMPEPMEKPIPDEASGMPPRPRADNASPFR